MTTYEISVYETDELGQIGERLNKEDIFIEISNKRNKK